MKRTGFSLRIPSGEARLEVPVFKPKKCKACRNPFTPTNSMQIVCCGVPCGRDYAQSLRAKKTKKEEAAERKADKEKLKRRADYLKEAQQAFNAFIRCRDRLAGYACISSGRPLDWSGNQVDAGHYRSTGAAPHLRFNEDNCHAQSKRENQYLAGNAVDYRVGLIARIGIERVEALESDQTPRKYTVDDLKAIKATYRAKARALEKAND